MNGPTRKDALWAVVGAALFAAVFLALWRFSPDPARVLASRASRVERVDRMQAGLAAASEAEKSAVLAASDPDSEAFAAQARAATSGVERDKEELARLIASAGRREEEEALDAFVEAFARLQRIDDQILGFAVRNTNVKAWGLAFGPAAGALEEVDAPLARIAARSGELQVVRPALSARASLLRIQALLAPHIAEASGAKMGRLEAAMAREEAAARRDLAALAALPASARDADLVAATAAFARYVEVERRILTLSRENTNLQSMALSLNQKRKALAECLAALAALRQVILDEPIPGVPRGRGPTR